MVEKERERSRAHFNDLVRAYCSRHLRRPPARPDERIVPPHLDGGDPFSFLWVPSAKGQRAILSPVHQQ
jgi:hypothetical protein